MKGTPPKVPGKWDVGQSHPGPHKPVSTSLCTQEQVLQGSKSQPLGTQRCVSSTTNDAPIRAPRSQWFGAQMSGYREDWRIGRVQQGRSRGWLCAGFAYIKGKEPDSGRQVSHAPTRMRNLGLNMYFKGSCVTAVDEREQEEREGNKRGDGCEHKVNPQHGLWKCPDENHHSVQHTWSLRASLLKRDRNEGRVAETAEDVYGQK